MDPASVFLGIGSSVAQNAANRYADEQSRAWQEYMWNKQNEYNLPKNQVQRLMEAGINPNIAFGSSASTLGASIPGAPATHVAPISDIPSKIAALESATANARSLNARSEEQELNNEIYRALFNEVFHNRKLELGKEYLKSNWDIEHGPEKWDMELRQVELQNDLKQLEKLYMSAKTHKTDQEVKNLEQAFNHFVDKYDFESMYYETGLNPYETSTLAGMYRTFFGLGIKVMELIKNFLGK